jgi:hypothetical protein
VTWEVRVKRKRRVRVHLVEPAGAQPLPSVEGILVSRRRSEYLVAVPQLITSEEGPPAVLESRFVAIPRDRVAFYEIVA